LPMIMISSFINEIISHVAFVIKQFKKDSSLKKGRLFADLLNK